MIYRILAFAVVLVTLCGILSAQEKAVVFEFEGIGVDQPTIEASTRIFANELNATGEYSVIPWGDVETKLIERGLSTFKCHQTSCAVSYGAIAGAQKSIIGSLTRLGGKITIEARLISVATEEVLFSDRFSSSSIEDLDIALRKVAEALSTQTKIVSEVSRYAITEEETLDARRKKSYITSGASFGFGFPLGDSYSKVNSLKKLIWTMRLEAGQFIINNSIGISWGSLKREDPNNVFQSYSKTVTIVPWDIGLRYLFSRKGDFSPFVGGGIGFHFIGSAEADRSDTIDGNELVKSDQALAIHLAGGLYAFQSYDFRLIIEAKYTAVFSDAFYDSGSTSHQIGISIALLRKFEKGEKRGCMGGGCLF